MEEEKEFKKEDLWVIQKLVGTKLDRMYKTLGMFVIDFVDKNGIEYSLHSFSFIRARKDNQIIFTGADEYYLPNYLVMPKRMCKKDKTNKKSLLFVTLKNTLKEVENAVVKSVTVTDTADIIISFDNGVVIETFTDCLGQDIEYYRFFEVNVYEPHYVVKSVSGKMMLEKDCHSEEYIKFLKSEKYLEKQNIISFVTMPKAVGFISEKTKNENECFDVILPFSCYEEYFESGLNVYKDEDITFENILGYVLNKKPNILNFGQKRFHKCYDACLCLLVIPYYNRFYEYVKNHINDIDKRILKMFKKQILSHLVDEKLVSLVKTLGDMLAGGKFYKENDCYNKSKEILELIDLRLKGEKVDVQITKKCKKYIAQIKWLTFEEGGRKMPPPFDSEHYAPQIKFEGQNNLDWSVCVNNYERINRYETLARMHYLIYVDAPDNLVPNLNFQLYEGPKLVANGEILSEIEENAKFRIKRRYCTNLSLFIK